MLSKFFLFIQNNSWGLIPNKKSALRAVLSLIIIVSSIWWIKYSIDSSKPVPPDIDKIKATIQKHKSEFPDNSKYVFKKF